MLAVIGFGIFDHSENSSIGIGKVVPAAIDAEGCMRRFCPIQEAEIRVVHQKMIRQQGIAGAGEDKAVGFVGVVHNNIIQFVINRKDPVAPGKSVLHQIRGDVDDLSIREKIFGRDTVPVSLFAYPDKRMVFSRNTIKMFVMKRRKEDGITFELCVFHPENQIEIAGTEFMEISIRLIQREFRRDIALLCHQRLQKCSDQMACIRIRITDAEFMSHPGVKGRNPVNGVVVGLQHGQGVREKLGSDLGESDTAGCPLEQFRSKFILKRLDLAGNSRLRHVQLFCGTDIIQCICESREALKLGCIHIFFFSGDKREEDIFIR